jgi:hypothetical protein
VIMRGWFVLCLTVITVGLAYCLIIGGLQR